MLSRGRLAAAFAAGLALGYGVHRLFRKKEEPCVEDSVRKSVILVVNRKLKMRAGKIAAQCGHASLGVFRKIGKRDPALAQSWLDGEFHKFVYLCADEKALDDLNAWAIRSQRASVIICDAGRTQIAAGSRTVIAIAPVTQSDVDELIREYGITAAK